MFCETLLDCVNKLPGDGRTMVGFLSFDHTLHFYNLKVSKSLCVHLKIVLMKNMMMWV